MYIYIHTIIYLIFTDVFWKHSLWIICRIIFPVVVFPEVSGDVEATQEKARQRELEEERQQPLALQVETPLLSTFFRTDRSLTIDAWRVDDALCLVFSMMLRMLKLISSKHQVGSKHHWGNRNGCVGYALRRLISCPRLKKKVNKMIINFKLWAVWLVFAGYFCSDILIVLNQNPYSYPRSPLSI